MIKVTNEDALNMYIEELEDFEPCSEMGFKIQECLRYAVFALERQEPKDYLMDKAGTIKCPRCYHILHSEVSEKYCCECGQKIRW